ncbi:MAG: class I SAM-dependent methyltransferase [Planctomycetes bacterium]|nr:class I SAM-dependent methyltransferase [Planctomycetota bacterium]
MMSESNPDREAPSPREVYDELYRRTGFGDAPRFYRWVTRRIAARPEDRILDIGCGAGGALVELERAHSSAIGLDFSAVALRAARIRTRLPLVQGDGTRLPFPDQSFDHVLNLGNLEHFAELGAGVREMRRVLKPDGRAWVLLPNLFYSGAIWRAVRFGTGPDHHQPIDRFATRAEWRAVLEAGGLGVIRSEPYHKGKWWKRMLPSNLAWHFLYETRPAQPVGRALPPLERRRPLLDGARLAD